MADLAASLPDLTSTWLVKASEHPGITAGRAHEESQGCPCWRAEQQDPECPLHGMPEFRVEPCLHPTTELRFSIHDDEGAPARVVCTACRRTVGSHPELDLTTG